MAAFFNFEPVMGSKTTNRSGVREFWGSTVDNGANYGVLNMLERFYLGLK